MNSAEKRGSLSISNPNESVIHEAAPSTSSSALVKKTSLPSDFNYFESSSTSSNAASESVKITSVDGVCLLLLLLY